MKENTNNIEFLLNISTNSLMHSNSKGDILFANKNANHFFNNQEAVGNNILSLFDEKNASILQEQLDFCWRNNKKGTVSITINERYYNFFIYPKNDKLAICAEDITESKHLSDMLHRTSERLNFAEKTAKIGYFEMDLKAKRIFWSAEMYRIFGEVSWPSTINKKIITEKIFPEDLDIYKKKMIALLRCGIPTEGQLRIKKNDGEITYCLYKSSLISDLNISKIAGTFQDITQLVEVQIALENAKHEAERLNLAKSYFLAQASHDLRQPMQALNMFISSLLNEPLGERQRVLVDKIENSANNLKSLLDNLLDISKLESGGVKYSPSVFNIGLLLHKLSFEFIEIAKLHKVRFRFGNCQHIVNTDPFLIERILRNLLSNAFKYTRNKVLLGCKQEGDKIRILVCDNGIGISKEEKEKIFEEFYQSNLIKNNKKQGAGLGLTIVKKICSLIKSDIKVTSLAGKGSCFYFDIPLYKGK